MIDSAFVADGAKENDGAAFSAGLNEKGVASAALSVPHQDDEREDEPGSFLISGEGDCSSSCS